MIHRYASQHESRSGLSTSYRDIAKQVTTTALLPIETRKARRLIRSGKLLKLHLGCADTYLPGWVNVDLARPGRRLDLRWDLRRPLPFPDRVADAIFAEHLIEHIDLIGGIRLLHECRRVLAPGGTLRLGVPDLERYVHSYLGTDPIIDAVRPDRPTRGLALGEVFFRNGHRAMYDFATLRLLLEEVGFGTVERCAFGESRLPHSPDSERRRPETLYVEAVK